MTNNSGQNHLTNFLWLLFLSSLWGPSFLLIKVAIEYVSPITSTASRIGGGALMLYVILKIKRVSLLKSNLPWLHLAVTGIFQSALPFSLFAIGEKSISSSLAAIICGAAPLFTLVLAHFCTHNDQLTKTKIIGATVGFSGLFILIFPSLFVEKSTSFGIFAATMAAVSYAIGFVYTKKHINVKQYPALTLPTLQLFLSFLILLPLALIFENPLLIKDAPMSALISLFFLAFFGTALAFVVYYKLIDLTSATYISMVNYIIPVFGVVLGMIILHEKLSWNSFLGCIMILIGVMIANKVISFPSKKDKPVIPGTV